MNLEKLKTIIDWFENSNLAELELDEADFKIHLVREGGVARQVPASQATEEPADVSNLLCAESNGVVHLKPEPGADDFVSIGETIESGQPLYILEAMKVFTTVNADRAGRLAEILVADGQEVRAGQPVMRFDT